MREIKFDIKIRHIETGNTFREILTLEEIMTSGKLYSKGIQEVVFKRQFANIKDKNGNELYDKDIVKDGFGYVFSISFEQYTFKGDLDSDITVVGWVKKWHDGSFSPIGYSKIENLECIGNEFENPELLS